MAKARRSRRTLTTLVVLVLISVSVITLDESGRAASLFSGMRSVARDVFSPVRSGVNGIIDPIGHFFAGAVHYGALQQENQKLQLEIGQLRTQLATSKWSQEQTAQLQRLLALEKLPAVKALPAVLAQVTAYGPSNFTDTVTINKGRNTGVDVGDPVMGSNGLVGRVVEAAHSTATVELITDGKSRVGVEYSPNLNQFATVAGQGPGRDLSVQLVSTNTVIHSGEPLVTDGLAGTLFPAGLPVAKVSTVKSVTGAADKQVTAEPVADLSGLSYVMVLQWSGST